MWCNRFDVVSKIVLIRGIENACEGTELVDSAFCQRGGILPFSEFAKFFAACTMASAGVTVGDVIYLCLNTTDSEPRFAFVSENQPK